ncbi:uncharacterized protein GBIM_02332 [Gryllus bimaculatus]|nr:uncharacterized protein GBIM_02332 [Gryllus bimaculatus]
MEEGVGSSMESVGGGGGGGGGDGGGGGADGPVGGGGGGAGRCGSWVRRRARGAFTRKQLLRRLPVLSWLPRYTGDDAVGDLVAGITVGLTVIPQALAYASIAGLPPQYGLYSSFFGCFVYIIFGSCKDVPMGPSAIISLLTAQAVNSATSYDALRPQYAVLLCFLVGIVQVLMGILGLGFVIDFISGPVSSGFTSAAALIIVSSQVKDLLGIKADSGTFVEVCISIFKNLGETSVGDASLGCVCIVVLLLMRLLAKVQFGPQNVALRSPLQLWATRVLWLVGTARNAILLLACGLVGHWLHHSHPDAVIVIGNVPSGLPAFKAPDFSISGNDTAEPPIEAIGFFSMLGNLGSGIVVVPLVALLEDIAVCKAFANGKAVDATQELLATGLSNFANSFVQAFPGTGALARSAVNNSSGVRTTFAGFYTGLLVILSLLFFTPYFQFIPKTSLAAIIIAAVIFMVEVHVVVPMWKTKKSDLLPGVGTFIACLVLPLEMGILVGIGINILFILYHAARPKIAMENLTTAGGTEYLQLTPDRLLIFPSVDYVRNLVTKYSLKHNFPVVIDCSHVYNADFTAAKPSIVNVFKGLQPRDFTVFYTESELDDLIKAHEKKIAKEELELGVSTLCKESMAVVSHIVASG